MTKDAKETISQLRLLLVCGAEEALPAYQAEFKRLGLNVDVVGTFAEVFQGMLNEGYHGVMVDLRTKSRAKEAEKDLFYNTLDFYPTVTMQWRPRDGQVKACYMGQRAASTELEDFLLQECAHFQPRTVRRDQRLSLHFNVLWTDRAGAPRESYHLGVLDDISLSGCYLITFERLMRDKSVWIIIPDLEDQTPIESKVRRVQPWGRDRAYPGGGLLFEGMTDAQEKELRGHGLKEESFIRRQQQRDD